MLVLLCSSSVEEQFSRTRRLVDGVWRSWPRVELPLVRASFRGLPERYSMAANPLAKVPHARLQGLLAR